MPVDLIVNVLLSGLLTGLVYGLMALGLSVIYGVVRIVNFAHGELMALAMYVVVIAFAALKLDPLWMVLPVALGFFGLGYVMQRALINPFIDRPEHSQFMLLLAVALIMVNGLLLAFGPDARNVQVDYALDSFQIGPLLVDKVRVVCAAVALACCALLWALFRFTPFGKAIRACADNLLGARVVWVPALGACVVGPALFFGITADLLVVALAGLIVYGLGRGFHDANLMPIVRSIADERHSATGYGLLNFIGCMVGGAMVYVGGWLKDAHVDLALVFQLSAAGLALAGVILFFLRPRPVADT